MSGSVVDKRVSHPTADAVAAAALGTAVLECVSPVEEVIAGGPLPFRPSAIAAALLRRLHLPSDPRRRRFLGRMLRWGYGPSWGLAYARLRPWLPRSSLLRACSLGAAIFSFELASLPPLVGRRTLFRWRTLAALAVHVGLFAAVTEAAIARLRHVDASGIVVCKDPAP